MLKDFYTLEKTESTESSYTATVALNTSHEIYKAHFPGNPITPGVCLLQMALELLNARFGEQFRMVEAKNIKYLKIINPLENPTIDFNIDFKYDQNVLTANINILSGNITFTKINAIYKKG